MNLLSFSWCIHDQQKFSSYVGICVLESLYECMLSKLQKLGITDKRWVERPSSLPVWYPIFIGRKKTAWLSAWAKQKPVQGKCLWLQSSNVPCTCVRTYQHTYVSRTMSRYYGAETKTKALSTDGMPKVTYNSRTYNRFVRYKSSNGNLNFTCILPPGVTVPTALVPTSTPLQRL